jgi:hypothetical protein
MKLISRIRFVIPVFSLIFLSFLTTKGQENIIKGENSSPYVSLQYGDTLVLPSFAEFDLPVKIKSSYSISAISLGFYFPVEYLVIDTMELIDDSPGAYYNITDSLFRMAWSDISPINVTEDDTIIMLKMNTLDISSLTNTIRLKLYPTSEFADQDANTIDGVLLEIPQIAFLKPDPGDSIGSNYVNIYPNPFDDFTTIYFSLEKESQVKITISTLSGTELKIFEDQTYPEGNYQVRIDGLNLAQGIFLLKFEIGNSEASGSKLFKLLSIK